jgi:hypothetical protein
MTIKMKAVKGWGNERVERTNGSGEGKMDFLENLLKIATKQEDVEFLVNLLFELKKDYERRQQ